MLIDADQNNEYIHMDSFTRLTKRPSLSSWCLLTVALKKVLWIFPLLLLFLIEIYIAEIFSLSDHWTYSMSSGQMERENISAMYISIGTSGRQTGTSGKIFLQCIFLLGLQGRDRQGLQGEYSLDNVCTSSQEYSPWSPCLAVTLEREITIEYSSRLITWK